SLGIRARALALPFKTVIDFFEKRLCVEELLKIDREEFQKHDPSSKRVLIRLYKIFLNPGKVAVEQRLEHRLPDVGVRLFPLRHRPHEHLGPPVLLSVGAEKNRDQDRADNSAERGQ